MKQGGFAPTGNWTRGAIGGVKAPAPILLPEPCERFTRTAKRLEMLALGHPAQEWLCFLASLAEAQSVAVNSLRTAALKQEVIEEAIEARMPPLALTEHLRDSVWRDGLSVVLDHIGRDTTHPEVSSVATALRGLEPTEIEALANQFLHGTVETADAGAVLYVAAALQAYFCSMAASLPVASLRLLPQRGHCPSCGSTPSAGLVTATGQSRGARYLYCSLCGTAWNHVRAVCITCGESSGVSLRGIEHDAGIVKAETCTDCYTYAKMIYQERDTKADPFADDLASVGLDLLVAEAGWSRHAQNPLLLIPV